jgi:hypothetical protein
VIRGLLLVEEWGRHPCPFGEIIWASVGPAGHTPTCQVRSPNELTNQSM